MIHEASLKMLFSIFRSPCSVLWHIYQNEQIFFQVNLFVSFVEWTKWLEKIFVHLLGNKKVFLVALLQNSCF